METDSPVVYHGTSESRFSSMEDKIQQHMQWTNEEKDILRECNRESLYSRCLPISCTFMAATHWAVKKGFLSAHPVMGSTFKLMGAGFAGWFLGKLMYKTNCEEKFLKLENSKIGDAIRRKRGYIIDRDESEFFGSKTEDFDIKKDSYTSYSDYHSSTGSLNLDVDKNIQYSGLDDRERPSTDRDVLQTSEEAEPVRMFTTYDDLRRVNREEYARSQQRPYTQRSDQTYQPPVQRPWGNIDSVPPRRLNVEPDEGSTKNKYGDSWDNVKFL